MCAGLCIAMCIGMCIGMCTGMCIDTCAAMKAWDRLENVKASEFIGCV